jgi:hypothetical protein
MGDFASHLRSDLLHAVHAIGAGWGITIVPLSKTYLPYHCFVIERRVVENPGVRELVMRMIVFDRGVRQVAVGQRRLHIAAIV